MRRISPAWKSRKRWTAQVLQADEAKAFVLIDEEFDKRPELGEDGGTGAGDVTPA